MSNTVNSFDSLPQGTGYANVPAPATDADVDHIGQVPSTVHCLDSTNDPIDIQVLSIATQAINGPSNPAPAWNSGLADPMRGNWPSDVNANTTDTNVNP